MALALYLVVAAVSLLVWNRAVQPVSRAAALALLALPFLFTGRALFTGRVYAPADISFMAEPLSAFAKDYRVETPHNIALSDLHCQIIPWQKAVRHSLSEGQWPLWNPFILCGDILAAAAQPAVYDPVQLIGLILPLPDAVTFGAVMTFFLAALFTWAFARELGLSEVAALVAAAGFTFCGMLAFFVGWPLGRSWAFLPLVMIGARRAVHAGDLRSAVILTLGFVLTIFAGHPESVLHIVATGAVYGLFELVRTRSVWTRRFRSVLVAFASGIASLLLTAIYLLPFAEAVPQTLEHVIRTELYAATSYDVIARPETRAARMGRTFIPGYGGHPWKKTAAPGWDPLSARVGTPVLILALLGVASCFRKGETWFFLALAMLGLGATFGSWPVAHALHALPLFDIAINERLAFAAAFALSILAALAVDRMRLQPALLVLTLVLVQRSLEDGTIYPALPREAFYPRIPLLAAVPQDGRLAGLWFAFTANNAALYELEDARGYQAMTNKRLYETYPLWSLYQRAWFNRIDDLQRPFLSFLNVRYVLANADPPDGWQIVAEDRGTRLLENTRVLPRAFVPRRVRYVRDGKDTVEEMKQVTDFSDVAWIEAAEYDPHEAINGRGIVTPRATGLRYELDADMEQGGWVVVSATAWKGWRAYVDGRRVKPHFANHAFLGVFVPAGRHRIRLTYLPESFTRGRNISLATLAFLGMARLCYRTRACSRFFSTSSRP